jgi:hypothetical protein
MNKIRGLLKVSTVYAVFIALTFIAWPTIADEECTDQIAEWQPREILKKQLEAQGWVVKRIRIDDGCYEVRALDSKGRRVKATFTPASLTLLELEIKHDEESKREHYQPEHQ